MKLSEEFCTFLERTHILLQVCYFIIAFFQIKKYPIKGINAKKIGQGLLNLVILTHAQKRQPLNSCQLNNKGN